MGTATADHRAGHRLPLGLSPPVACAALLAAIYLVLQPRTVDLAAQVYRSGLFGREGFTVWDGGWYGGHHTPAYSVLFPPLGWLLGPSLTGALGAVAAAGLFERLTASRVAAAWFGIGSAALLFTGRMPFVLGVAVGLGALLGLARGRVALALVLAAAASLTSPVAGAFLALACIALASRQGLALAAAALAPIALLSLAFPEGGYEPFSFSSYVAIPLFAVAALALVERPQRALRLGVALYALAGTAAFLVHTPVGGNAVRLGSLFAGPVLAGARLRGSRALLLVLFAALAYWQLQPAVRDTRNAYEDPSTQASYYAPLVAELRRLGGPPGRIEVPFTRGHWEAAEVAPHMPLARGWERQLDIARNPIFYRGRIDAAGYRGWLADNAVRLVALADAQPDYSSAGERDLIARGLPFLRPLWRSRHWRLYAVTAPHPLALGASVLRLDSAAVTLAMPRPGPVTVKVAWSPYWLARGACVERAGNWTRVEARRPGRLRLAIAFAPARVLDRGRRCG